MRLLGVDNACFLDHSDYEGADLLFDLNEPLPPELEGTFDLIIDGGTLDNVFNPTQAMMNIARMLRAGGRVLTYNVFSRSFFAVHHAAAPVVSGLFCDQ